ncbi:MAG: TlpA family protein disulfide reductase [Myxococcota bacterium]|nr:TlpA family protein disulfide reductase [Myxococcota bacterium]
MDFSFESLDDRPVNAQVTRGAPTVLAFVTTASLPAQAQVDFLVAMARHDGERVHYAVVALDGKDSRELVELYRKALSIPFPVAMADLRTLAGRGDFGDVKGVPVTVVLDRHGRLVSRVDGRVAKSAELRAAMHGL